MAIRCSRRSGRARIRTAADSIDTTAEGAPRIVPLRAAPGFEVSHADPDPRGLPVIGADGRVAGTVVDVWVDRAEVLFRYLEVAVGRHPPGRARCCCRSTSRASPRSRVKRAFDPVERSSRNVPGPDNGPRSRVTLLEEDKIMGYYGGGTLYATPQRQEPLL